MHQTFSSNKAVLYPAIFFFLLFFILFLFYFFLGGGWFFDELSKEKNCCAAEVWWGRGQKRGQSNSSSVWSRDEALENFGYFAFWIVQNIALTTLRQRTVTKAYTRNQHVWGSEFGIPNQYTSFKIALDMALQGYQLFDEFLIKTQMFDKIKFSICTIHQTGFIKHSNFLIVH